ERDLTDDILAKIPQESWRPPVFNWVFAVRMAACFVLAVAGGLLALHLTTAPDPAPIQVVEKAEAVDQALAWLSGSQEPDGSWHAKKWGGHKDYNIGLTGLAVLAFLSGDNKPLDGTHTNAIGNGIKYLISQQSRDGRFGPPVSGSMYNHGIATVALLEAYGLIKDDRLKQPADAALTYIIDAQKSSGGWGYRKGTLSPPNTSISIWQIHALLIAKAMGWNDAGEQAAKGLAWLEGVVDEKGMVGYEKAGDFPYGSQALTAMGASYLVVGADPKSLPDGVRMAAQGEEIDFYRWYFLTYALRAVEEIRSDPLEIRLHQALAEQQVKTGPDAGSWEPSDQWGAAGGRVYSTALAVLSLETDTRVPRILNWLDNLR
ncbi:prenyltransferase/squalene oxidase repeat-containing protein, partial [Planctomycetota bacterium]